MFINFLEIFPYTHRCHGNSSFFSGWGFETEMVVRVFYGIGGFIPHTTKDTATLGMIEERKVKNLLRKARKICFVKMNINREIKVIVEELRKKYPQGSIGQ